MAAGWPRATAQEAGQLAAETLVDLVQPYAKVLIEEHRAAGRQVVIATTTPYDLVQAAGRPARRRRRDRHPLRRARRASTPARIDGEFVWGHGQVPGRQGVGRRARRLPRRQLRLLRQLLRRARCSTRSGTPSWSTRTRACASRPWPAGGPPSTSTCRRASPSWPGSSRSRRCSRSCGPGWRPTCTSDIVGHRQPAARRARPSWCANHRSYFDVAALGFAFAKRGRPVRFLGKKEVFDAPVVGDLARAMGGIRVERGTGSDEPLQGGRSPRSRPVRWSR